MSLVSIIIILTETSGKGPFIATVDDTLNILPKRYPTGQSSNILVLIHDAFQSLDYWNGFMSKGSQYIGVGMDTHRYQMFDDQVCPSSTPPGAFDQHPLMGGHLTTADCIARRSRAYPVCVRKRGRPVQFQQ